MNVDKSINTKALENTKAQMRKGVLELCILSIIAEQEEAYPSDMIKQLRESDLILKEGTLYPLLSRMRKAGWLHYRLKETSKGPARKYYHLTENGQIFLSSLLGTWNKLVHAVTNSTKNIEDISTEAPAADKTDDSSDTSLENLQNITNNE